jgi:hypothetical protein
MLFEFAPPFVAFYPRFAFQSALRVAGASSDPAPKERDIYPRTAVRLATRGLASHTELPKLVSTIPTYLVYDKVMIEIRIQAPHAAQFPSRSLD